MPPNSYPRPVSTRSYSSQNPRLLLPIPPLPSLWAAQLPQLPSPQRTCILSGYTMSTHMLPAAYMRTAGSEPEPKHPPEETKEMRKQRLIQLGRELVKKREKIAEKERSRVLAGIPPDMDEGLGPLWLVVNRYVQNNVKSTSGITLILAHANGFHKETWEPTLRRLVENAKPMGVVIEEIWSLEAVNHGDSALINERYLGDIFDWADNARDILHFMIHYLPEIPTSDPLPTHLPRLPDELSQPRTVTGYSHRTVVTIGHSVGGCSMAYAAISFPALFSSIILVDPVIAPAWYIWTKRHGQYISAAVTRRSKWSSWSEARQALDNPFFASWHQEPRELFAETAMVADKDGGVKLKTSGFQEAALFAEYTVPSGVWEMLPQLDERIPLRWIMSGKDNNVSGGPTGTPETVWRRTTNTSNVTLPAGHLVVQETPDLLASEISEFLRRTYVELKSKF